MKHGITVCTLGDWPVIEISEAEFGAFKFARTGLMTILHIEEKFDALLENYSEYEQELLGMTLNSLVHGGGLTWDSGVTNAFRINRRLANLLTMTRLYTDQVKQDVKSLLTSVAPQVVSGLFSKEYDTHFEYRLMEALRNHVQHYGMPITRTTYPRSWEDRGDEERAAMRFSITVHLSVDQIRENPEFKSSVLAEVAQRGQLPDLSILVRKYVECFSRIHNRVRELLREKASDWRVTFLSAFDRSQSQLGDRPHVDVIRQDADDNVIEEIALVKDLLERITSMEQRNPQLTTLSLWFISTEVR